METKIQIIGSGVRVSRVGTIPTKKTTKVYIERKMTSKGIADDMASRITAKLIGFGDLFDPKTKQFLSESELKAKGAVFISVSMNKILVAGKDMVKKSRVSKMPTPFIRKTTKYMIIANIDWQSYINRRSNHGDFVASEKRSNGVENYEECRAIGITRAENHTINGVAFKNLEKTRYYDENSREYTDVELLTSEYLNVTSKASKEKAADKHGIELEFDPQYRTTRIDNCDIIRAFGFEYKPTDNHSNS